jgi:hypothetical protein
MWDWVERYGELIVSGLDLVAFLLVTPELVRIVRPVLKGTIAFIYVYLLGFVWLLAVIYGIEFLDFLGALRTTPGYLALIVLGGGLPVAMTIFFSSEKAKRLYTRLIEPALRHMLSPALRHMLSPALRHMLSIGICLIITARIIAFAMSVHKAVK